MSGPGYKSKTGQLAQTQIGSPPADRGDFYLFYSFDLVNSTRFKTQHRDDWLEVFLRFYEIIKGGMDKWLNHAKVWKYVGDEVLFYQKVQSISDVHECVPKAYDLLNDSITKLHSAFPATRTLLSIKGAVWIARVLNHHPEDYSIDANILLSHYMDPDDKVLDFLGPEIDVGFRISKFSARRRLVVSADLALLIHQDEDNPGRHNLRIVSFEEIKGVWANRRYPIIWYEPNWTKVKETFLYDERFESPLVERILSIGPTGINGIEGIYRDLGRLDEMEVLLADIKKVIPEEDTSPFQVPPENVAEVHCVAVCFNDKGEVLVAKRKQDKKRLPGKWEFGCGQLRWHDTFEECLIRSYREDFDAKLDLVQPLVPIKTFTIDDAASGRQIPGIIFIAECKNPKDVISKKHEDIKWLTPDRPGIEGGDAVPGFNETLKLAVAAMQRKERK